MAISSGVHGGLAKRARTTECILLVAPAEHKVRIETGYGATTFLTDAMSGIIIRNSILPHFKRDPPDYGGGIEAGAGQIITQMSLPADQAQKNVAAAEQSQRQRQDSGPGVLAVIFWMVIILFVIGSMFRGSRGRRYRSRGYTPRGGISPWVVLWGLNELSRGSRGGGWGGGGGGSSWGGGGFGGFSGGGGSFGGGGASGSW